MNIHEGAPAECLRRVRLTSSSSSPRSSKSNSSTPARHVREEGRELCHPPAKCSAAETAPWVIASRTDSVIAHLLEIRASPSSPVESMCLVATAYFKCACNTVAMIRADAHQLNIFHLSS